jgi:hypothetical protein
MQHAEVILSLRLLASLPTKLVAMLATSGSVMASEQWARGGSLRTWRASVRYHNRGGYRLGMIVAPSREAAEATAAELYNLSAEDRARLWLIDLSPHGPFYHGKRYGIRRLRIAHLP